MATHAVTQRRWTRAEYDRLIGLGIFVGENIELIGGQLVVAEPQYPCHASAVSAIDRVLQRALPPEWTVRCQLPVALDDESEPEPDVAVVRGAPGEYMAEHPVRPALIIEVAQSSLHFDRRHKESLYARGGVRDYWIVNLVDRVVEVYRDPERHARARYGWRYRSIDRLVPPAIVIPLVIPSMQIAVADLLPARATTA